MKLGVMLPLDGAISERFSELHGWNIPTCQLVCRREGMCTPAAAELLRRLTAEHGIEITHGIEPAEGMAEIESLDLPLKSHPWGVKVPILKAQLAKWGDREGYKAALNWWIDFSAWAEYREEGADSPVRTGICRWRLRWSPVEPTAERVELSIEAP